MFDIERQIRKSKSIPLISLIDVVFQLLIYFMLSTSFTRAESLELSIPAAHAPVLSLEKKESRQTVHIYVADNGETFLESKSLNPDQMAQQLKSLLALNPERGVLVLSAGKVSVQALVQVMDRIYTAGGKNIAVADWNTTPAVPTAIPVQGSKS